MPITRLRRARRLILRVAAALSILSILALIGFLPFAGRYLMAEDPLAPADVIFVLGGARAERWLESVDLYRDGHAPHVLLSIGRPEDAETRLRAMGIRYPSEPELARDAMEQMGVPAASVTLLPRPVDNTAQEAEAIHPLATAAGWRRIIVITSKYHTRRSGFAFRREFDGTGVQIIVRATRYDTATPDRWWTSRGDVRFVTSEFQKLLLYRLGLGG